MDDLSIQVGKRLTELRKSRGISQSKVARGVGTPASVVCRWESGTFCPGAYWLIRIADFYGCSVDEILGRGNEYEHS